MFETYMTEKDLEVVKLVMRALTGRPDFNSYIIRGIARHLMGGRRGALLASKRHLMKDEALLSEATEALRAAAEPWEVEDLFQELRLVMERIASKAKDGPTRDYYISKSFRYEVPRFFRLEGERRARQSSTFEDKCPLYEQADVDEWVLGECNEALEALTSWERRILLAIDSEGMTVSEAARRFGYSRQHLSRRYNTTKQQVYQNRAAAAAGERTEGVGR
ncbi:hypothetical protein C0431_12425 [bacterium]|nr:hypothetical protein [bacterium]